MRGSYSIQETRVWRNLNRERAILEAPPKWNWRHPSGLQAKSKRVFPAPGWSNLDIEYDQGAGLQRELFDAGMSGPLLGFQYAW